VFLRADGCAIQLFFIFTRLEGHPPFPPFERSPCDPTVTIQALRSPGFGGCMTLQQEVCIPPSHPSVEYHLLSSPTFLVRSSSLVGARFPLGCIRADLMLLTGSIMPPPLLAKTSVVMFCFLQQFLSTIVFSVDFPFCVVLGSCLSARILECFYTHYRFFDLLLEP